MQNKEPRDDSWRKRAALKGEVRREKPFQVEPREQSAERKPSHRCPSSWNTLLPGLVLGIDLRITVYQERLRTNQPVMAMHVSFCPMGRAWKEKQRAL